MKVYSDDGQNEDEFEREVNLKDSSAVVVAEIKLMSGNANTTSHPRTTTHARKQVERGGGGVDHPLTCCRPGG